MSMTIGRYSGTDDPDGGSIRQSGDVLSFDFDLSGSSVADMQAKVQQLRGLVDNPDETVIPFTWSEDANHDGYYTDVRVDVNDTPMALATGYSRCSISMRRIAGGFARPMIESVYTGVVRTNAHAVTTPSGILSSWPSTNTTGADSTFSSFAPFTLNADSNFYASTTVWPVATSSAVMYVPPADYYKAGARLEALYGSTYYPVPGRQTPSAMGTNWRLSNGVVRVYPTSVSGNGRFTVERWNGAAWVGREFTWGIFSGIWVSGACTTDSSGGTITNQVLTNRIDTVTLRASLGTRTHDFTIQSGAPYIEVATNMAASQIGFGCSAVVASTAFTGGARATANDANGLRYLISSTPAVTTDLVNGRVYTTAATAAAVFQIDPDYQTGVLASTDTGRRDTFLAARSERRTVVPR